jgi:hypothetical protein
MDSGLRARHSSARAIGPGSGVWAMGTPTGGEWGRPGITRIASFQAAGCRTADTRAVGPG